MVDSMADRPWQTSYGCYMQEYRYNKRNSRKEGQANVQNINGKLFEGSALYIYNICNFGGPVPLVVFFDPIFFLLKKNQSAVLVTDRLTYNYSI
jgi:hypothetical protein